MRSCFRAYRACTSYATHAPDLRILPSRPQLSCTPAHLPTCAPAGEHGRQLPKLGMILAGVGMASATPSSVHEGPAVSSSMPPLESALKSRPAWDSRTRRILNSDCRTNLKLVNLDKWCYQLPLATCNRYYYAATTGRLKVPYALTILHDHKHYHNEHTGSRAETIGTTSHIPYSPLTAPHPPSKECQVREGKCDAFTTNSVVGCTGSEVRHAFASHLLLANPPRPSSTSPSHQAPCFPTQTPNHPSTPPPDLTPNPPPSPTCPLVHVYASAVAMPPATRPRRCHPPRRRRRRGLRSHATTSSRPTSTAMRWAPAPRERARRTSSSGSTGAMHHAPGLLRLQPRHMHMSMHMYMCMCMCMLHAHAHVHLHVHVHVHVARPQPVAHTRTHTRARAQTSKHLHP